MPNTLSPSCGPTRLGEAVAGSWLCRLSEAHGKQRLWPNVTPRMTGMLSTGLWSFPQGRH